jgi:hypothetical protein
VLGENIWFFHSLYVVTHSCPIHIHSASWSAIC